MANKKDVKNLLKSLLEEVEAEDTDKVESQTDGFDNSEPEKEGSVEPAELNDENILDDENDVDVEELKEDADASDDEDSDEDKDKNDSDKDKDKNDSDEEDAEDESDDDDKFEDDESDDESDDEKDESDDEEKEDNLKEARIIKTLFSKLYEEITAEQTDEIDSQTDGFDNSEPEREGQVEPVDVDAEDVLDNPEISDEDIVELGEGAIADLTNALTTIVSAPLKLVGKGASGVQTLVRKITGKDDEYKLKKASKAAKKAAKAEKKAIKKGLNYEKSKIQTESYIDYISKLYEEIEAEDIDKIESKTDIFDNSEPEREGAVEPAKLKDNEIIDNPEIDVVDIQEAFKIVLESLETLELVEAFGDRYLGKSDYQLNSAQRWLRNRAEKKAMKQHYGIRNARRIIRNEKRAERKNERLSKEANVASDKENKLRSNVDAAKIELKKNKKLDPKTSKKIQKYVDKNEKKLNKAQDARAKRESVIEAGKKAGEERAKRAESLNQANKTQSQAIKDDKKTRKVEGKKLADMSASFVYDINSALENIFENAKFSYSDFLKLSLLKEEIDSTIEKIESQTDCFDNSEPEREGQVEPVDVSVDDILDNADFGDVDIDELKEQFKMIDKLAQMKSQKGKKFDPVSLYESAILSVFTEADEVEDQSEEIEDAVEEETNTQDNADTNNVDDLSEKIKEITDDEIHEAFTNIFKYLKEEVDIEIGVDDCDKKEEKESDDKKDEGETVVIKVDSEGNVKVENGGELTEALKIKTLTEAYNTPGYYKTDSIQIISKNDKIKSLTESLAIQDAKFNKDYLFNELVKAANKVDILKEEIMEKYGEAAAEKALKISNLTIKTE